MFAAVALVLAALGLYGLMSYWVEQRTREIGIRVALGATDRKIVHLVMWAGLQWACAGVVIGLGGALAFGQALSNMLFGITATDPVTLAAVIVVLMAVAGAASSPFRLFAR